MISLEYFADCSKDCPLILIYNHEMDDVLRLILAIKRVASGSIDYVDIHDIKGFNSVGGCQLRLQKAKGNYRGVRFEGENVFIWEMSSEECFDVIGLLEPFLHRTGDLANKSEYQYLEQNGEITIIFSTNKHW